MALALGVARADCDEFARWRLELVDVEGDGNVDHEFELWPNRADLTNGGGPDAVQQFNGDRGDTRVIVWMEV
jgi:hypothetical protein